jgi:hypothetical protein
MSPGAVQVWFHRLYREKLGLTAHPTTAGGGRSSPVVPRILL